MNDTPDMAARPMVRLPPARACTGGNNAGPRR